MMNRREWLERTFGVAGMLALDPPPAGRPTWPTTWAAS